jgi:NAD(P)-dependent dehydrogenase (short-subunit alcohol dehydrogenase family)
LRLRDKIIVITGASGALGKEVAKECIDEGAEVFALVRNVNKLKELTEAVGDSSTKLLPIEADVTDYNSIKSAFDAVLQKRKKVDCLLNIAGGFRGGKFIADMPVEDWLFMLDLNLNSVFYASKIAMGIMAGHGGGKIVNVAAMSIFDIKPKKAAYNVAKAGVVALTQALAVEGKAFNIQVNAIAPSTILTEANVKDMPDADYSKWVTPARIAETMIYLCSNAADDITGTVIRMPGRV